VPWKPDYITLAELKSFLDIADSVDDVQLQMWCTAASRAIDKKTNRQFGQLTAAAARVYRRPAFYEPSSQLWMVEIDDVQDVTGMTVGGVAYASSGATLLPDNAPPDGVPWTRLGFATCPTAPLTVVARWGWTTVPTQVVAAAKLQANRWNARRRSPLGVAGSPEQGSELRLLAKLDPDVATTLAGLSRRRQVG
jgi:hypothetical protein